MADNTLRVTIDTADLDKVADNIAAAGRNVPTHRRTMITRVGQLVMRAAQREAPEGKTRELRRSIGMTVVGGGSGALITEGARHGVFVREGTKPHVIVPRHKKALYWPGAAHPVKRVSHPGTKANPYHARAVEDSRTDIEEAAGEMVGKIAIEVTKKV